MTETATRIALIGIILESASAVEPVNALLHEYRDYIVGRMGLPYKNRGVSIISVVIDAPVNAVNALTGKLGMIDHLSVKTMFSNK